MNKREELGTFLRNRKYYQNRLKFILEHIHPASKDVLDLGCGEMWLKSLSGTSPECYTGVDHLRYPASGNYICADLLEYASSMKKFQQIWLIGVLDHLSFEKKMQLLGFVKKNFSEHCIITQHNSFNLFSRFLAKEKPVNLPEIFSDYHIYQLSLLKWPYSKRVMDLSKFPVLIRMFCTEIVYIIACREEV